MKLYLAHPFLDRYEIRLWEDTFEYRTGIELVNPFYDVNREDIDLIDAGKKARFDLDPEKIVMQDLNTMFDCDGILAVITKSQTVGTIMEIAYAYNNLDGPIYLVCPPDLENHPWLQHHATTIFSCLAEFQAHMESTIEEASQCES
jgi:nucleoside 2-deoxyribosyltransferase